MNLKPDPGSLHDPSSQVLVDEAGDRIVRVLDAAALADFERLTATKLWAQAQATGEIVATRRLRDVPDPSRRGWIGALEHDRVPVVSYPSEWTFSMLRTAALLHLDLVERAVAEGMCTKDASPYNVQFVGSRPTFIDVGSFTPIRSGEPWFGFRQFCEQFLNPLVVHAYGRLPLPRSLRGSVNGISPSLASRLLPRRAKVRPSLFTTIVLHAAADRRLAGRDADVRSALNKAGAGPTLITAQVRRLRKIIESLDNDARASEWSGYSERTHYSAEALLAKEKFVAAAVARTRPGRVVDLGANDGAFSKVALEHGARYVVATDSDATVVDRLFVELATRQDERILPLCVDLTDMVGTHGWAGVQRAALIDRAQPQMVLCLALVHHLAISASVRIVAIVELLARFESPVVLEVPLPGDPMVARLLSRKRDGGVPGYTREAIEQELRQRFDIRTELTLPGSTRVMYDLVRR